MTLPDVYRFLVEQNLGVLSSLSHDGAPQSALVGIAVTPAFEIVFDTLNSSRKFTNLVAHPACSLVIGWKGEVTVQYEGDAFLPNGPELSRYQELYCAAWPDGPQHLSWPGITYFVVRPRWIRYSDYDQRPPCIQEFRF